MNGFATITRPSPEQSLQVIRANLSDPEVVATIERFVEQAGGTVFHRPAWLLAVERGTGQRAHGLMCRNDWAGEGGGDIIGWLPLTEVHSPVFGRMLASSGFSVAGGALTDSRSVECQLLKASVELSERLSCPVVELRGRHGFAGWEAVTGKHSSFSADLAASDEEQLSRIPRKQRAEVRQALLQDFSIAIGRDAAAKDAHYRVFAQSVHRLGTPVFPKALFSTALEALDGDILTVSYQGVPVASVLSFYHSGTAMPYWGGGTPMARQLGANDRLYFELMRHARTRGCTRFDFGRSKVGSGAWHYKRNWGFEPTPLTYARWSCDGAHVGDADPTSARNAKRIVLWKRLPLSVATGLGPWISRGLA